MEKENKISVFLCQCNGQISDALSLKRIEAALKKIPNLFVVSDLNFPCSKSGLRVLKAVINDQKVNRVVIAGCSPRLMGGIFTKTIAETGLNPNLIEIVNIRDLSARVHQKEKSQATDKTIELIKDAIRKVSVKQPLEKLTGKIKKNVAVIGGGIAGITAALNLAKRGINVLLLEKEAQLGGLLNSVYRLYPSEIETSEFLNEKIVQLKSNKDIKILTNSEVVDIAGSVGKYEIAIQNGAQQKKIEAGAIVFAVGSQYFYPEGWYGYRKNEKVITQLEFEKMLRQHKVTAKQIAFIQCVGSRNEERPYCSRFCCPTTFKNVLMLKRKNPELNITVMFRGLTEYIREYDEAVDLGVLFIRYDAANPPQMKNDFIYVTDEKTDKNFEIPFDLLVLATPTIPLQNAKQWGKKLRQPVDKYGFILEPHVKLRPDHFAPTGIFVAGSVHWPGLVSDCIGQGVSAASRAFSLLQQEFIERQPIVAEIDPGFCRGCERCLAVCSFQAIKIMQEDGGLQHAEIDKFVCKGCGMCATVCICGAVQVKHLINSQLKCFLN